jgi:hypothetical protein
MADIVADIEFDADSRDVCVACRPGGRNKAGAPVAIS